MPSETQISESPIQRFKEIENEASLRAEAYQLRVTGRLWWANLCFVVLPAVCATAAAIFAAGGAGIRSEVSRALAAGLAGLAAVLTAIHKSLKCEEYQAECLRLFPEYDGIAERAQSAQVSTVQADQQADLLKDLTERLANLKASAKAPLPDKYINDAKKILKKRAEDCGRH